MNIIPTLKISTLHGQHFFFPPITLLNMSHCRSNSWNLFIVCATMMIQCKQYAVLIKAKYSALGVSTQPHKLHHYSSLSWVSQP